MSAPSACLFLEFINNYCPGGKFASDLAFKSLACTAQG